MPSCQYVHPDDLMYFAVFLLNSHVEHISPWRTEMLLALLKLDPLHCSRDIYADFLLVPPAGCINDGYNGQRCPGCESLTLFDPRRSLWPPSSTPGSSAFCFCSE
ncbi:hypothetical protein, variant 2 [Cladophialophora immunda]|nr:hypothetical protein, variant 2 [Cladophialophora immunda]KIW31587.1 hypothetical protein, variant 2 [Cladophialophora immunda]